MAALERTVGRRIPSLSITTWNFQSRTVNAVKEMKDAIIKCCDNLLTSRSQQTGFVADGIKHALENPYFEFWLNFFAKIMPRVDLLYAPMQSRLMNSAFANAAINNFNLSTKKIRDEIGSSTSTLNIKAENDEPKCKRRCSNYIPDANEVCDIVSR